MMVYIYMVKRRGKREARVCKNCTKDFEALLIKVRIGKGKFCSTECYRLYRIGNRKDPAELARYHRMKHLYGITRQEIECMLKESKNKCRICGISISISGENRLAIDHDHKTRKVRGLLCSLCNTGLGMFKDNPEILKSAIEYLVP